MLLLGSNSGPPLQIFSRKRKSKVDTDLAEDEANDPENDSATEEDKKLEMNPTIGTALMVVNSHRALFLLLCISIVFPVIYTLGNTNTTAANLVKLLQANNLAANTTADCDYLQNAVQSWKRGAASEHTRFSIYGTVQPVFVFWAQVLPVRCPWQYEDPYNGDGVITVCPTDLLPVYQPCRFWLRYSPDEPENATPAYFAAQSSTRVGGILDLSLSQDALLDRLNETFSVRVIVDENSTLSFT